MATTLKTEDIERLETLLVNLEQAKKDKAEQNVIKDKIMDFMRQLGIKTFRQGNIVMRLTDTRTTNEFDVDMLREKYPQIWEECHSQKTRDPHLQIKRVASKQDVEDDVPSDEELNEA